MRSPHRRIGSAHRVRPHLVGGFGPDLDGEARTHRFVAGVHGGVSLKERASEDGVRRLRPGATSCKTRNAGEPTERDQKNQHQANARVIPNYGFPPPPGSLAAGLGAESESHALLAPPPAP